MQIARLWGIPILIYPIFSEVNMKLLKTFNSFSKGRCTIRQKEPVDTTRFYHINLGVFKFRVKVKDRAYSRENPDKPRSYLTYRNIPILKHIYKTNMGIGYNGIESKLIIFYK